MLKEIGSVFSFLTIIPTSNSNLETIAKYMYIFPIVGIAIGLIVGSIGFGLSLFLDPLIVSLLVVASFVILTGIHHTDGLADFAIVSRFELLVGIIVRNEKTEPISLSMNPPSQRR